MGATPQQAWKDEHIAFLRTHRPRMTITQLIDLFEEQFGLRRSVYSIQKACCRYDIKAGSTGQFTPGHRTWNTNLVGWQAGGKAPGTQYKSGHRPQTWQPIGARTRTSKGIWKVKIKDMGSGLSRFGWRELHRMIWEEAHGTQSPGTAIVFVDGNPDNLTLDNLICLTRGELAMLNQMGWRNLTDDAARRALIAQARLLSAAHTRGRESGLSYYERQRLLPRSVRIGASVSVSD